MTLKRIELEGLQHEHKKFLRIITPERRNEDYNTRHFNGEDCNIGDSHLYQIESHEKELIEQSAPQMTEKQLAKYIFLFLQNSDSSYDKESTMAGLRLYLWAKHRLESKK
jgi:hypothetical protein